MTLLARIGMRLMMMRLMMMMKSHFLKRCSLSERLKKALVRNTLSHNDVTSLFYTL